MADTTISALPELLAADVADGDFLAIDNIATGVTKKIQRGNLFNYFVTLSGVQTLTNKTLTAPTVNGGTHTAIISFSLRSAGSGAFDLTVRNTENLSAGRMLTIVTGDADRTLTLSGNATITGSNTGDQNISITGDVTAAGSTGALAATVVKINGTSLAGLATGILKNTTATGVPSIAGAGDFPALNQNTTGSAASVSVSGQTGLITFTGLTVNNRVKTVRNADDTLLELGGNYTPTGTWTSLTMVTPVLGTPTSGNLANCTFPTLNQNSTGSAASLSVSGQTGLITFTGLLSNNRVKTLRDAADTILELAGSYTPTGTWTSMTFVTPVLGTPTSGNLSNCTADGTDSVGFRNIPQNSRSAAYTTVLADGGKHIFHPVGDANARTFTIDSNANVAYPPGTAITFINRSASNVTIAITTDTLTLAGAGTTGSRTLAQYGVATAIKITTTEWIISGTNLT